MTKQEMERLRAIIDECSGKSGEFRIQANDVDDAIRLLIETYAKLRAIMAMLDVMSEEVTSTILAPDRHKPREMILNIMLRGEWLDKKRGYEWLGMGLDFNPSATRMN